MNDGKKWAVGIGGATAAGLVAWWLLPSNDRKIKDTPADALPQSPANGKTGYKRIDAIFNALRAVAQATGIPLGLLIGWIAKESGGKLAEKPQPGPGDTSMDERGYFQLTPDESKTLGLDHQRLSSDSDYSIDAGVKLIRHYQSAVNDLNVAPAGSAYYWRLVKLGHSMGSGQLKKVVKAAQAAGQAGSWSDLETFALGMKLNGPQPKKWFPFVDLVYSVGAPFGFGSEAQSVVGAATSGFGIKDGRGYGPYKTGYYTDDSGCDCPLGPNGEPLSLDYDYQCGAGGYLTALRPPRKLLPGYLMNDVMPQPSGKTVGLVGLDVFATRRVA